MPTHAELKAGGLRQRIDRRPVHQQIPVHTERDRLRTAAGVEHPRTPPAVIDDHDAGPGPVTDHGGEFDRTDIGEHLDPIAVGDAQRGSVFGVDHRMVVFARRVQPRNVVELGVHRMSAPAVRQLKKRSSRRRRRMGGSVSNSRARSTNSAGATRILLSSVRNALRRCPNSRLPNTQPCGCSITARQLIPRLIPMIIRSIQCGPNASDGLRVALATTRVA